MALNDDVRIEWNDVELHAVARAEYARQQLALLGGKVADVAQGTAPRSAHPRAVGHGADSIHAETVREGSEWTVRVSWDQLHAYMRFTNLGTKHIPAQHYLEHAADRYARP